MRFLQIHRVTPKTGAKRRANENSLFIGGAYCAVLTIFLGGSPQKKLRKNVIFSLQTKQKYDKTFHAHASDC